MSGEASLIKASLQDDIEAKPTFEISESEGAGTNGIRVENASVTGWQLNLVLFGKKPLNDLLLVDTSLASSLLFALLLSALETTIIATTLVNIASSFGHLDISGWIVTAYLLTYTGFLIVFARLSDLFGLKNAVFVGLGFFTVFSGVCGAAQSIDVEQI
jgi:hypothetical protein